MRVYSWSTCCALTSIALISIAACQTEFDDPGFAGGIEAVPARVLGQPLPGLTADEDARFEAGKDEFQDVETIQEGLGPVFNEASCSICHSNPLGGTNGRVETRFGRLSADGAFDPMTSVGGSLIQDHGIGQVGADPTHVYSGEVVPAEATIRAGRITTPLFGLGLVDAVPDQSFLDLAQREAAATPLTVGTPNMVLEISSGQMRVGRFGWKAQVPTLFQFSGDAYVNEMGVTNPEFPAENCPQGDCAKLAFNPAPDLNDDGGNVAAFHDFMTFLAPPGRGAVSAGMASTGSRLFAQIGCASCHTPVLVTGPSPVAALSNKMFRPFSDFLLHDMGSLGDGVTQGGASGTQMRTAPLWGIHMRAALLHDGRATTLPQAITAHDGQGRMARDLFLSLSVGERAALLAFVKSL
ncbi:MAG TPA: di-heme oxidoredictase family protein [Gemmatimonadales bacterium]|nr:di-heme oxidoredictase family protein [Gemmatimonadales bacterium]